MSTPAVRLSLRMARTALGERSVQLANLGYFGHMWELYAMWSWVAVFAGACSPGSATCRRPRPAASPSGRRLRGGRLLGAGALGDRWVRRRGPPRRWRSPARAPRRRSPFGAPPALVLRCSGCGGSPWSPTPRNSRPRSSELAPPGTAGSALALQTAAGFLLTGVTMIGVGLLDPGTREGWTVAFAILAVGPLVGIIAMARLRGRPDAGRMAGGRR